jgi:hypothetical protein
MITLTTRIAPYGKSVDQFADVTTARRAVTGMARGYGYDLPSGARHGRFERRGRQLGTWDINDDNESGDD